MAQTYSYQGIRNSCTFTLDSATATAIADNPQAIVGKVVAVTGEYMVGYGTAGKAPRGFVEQIEKECSNSAVYTVTVSWGHSAENIPCAGTEAPGDYMACNGTGGLQKSQTTGSTPAAVVTNCDAWSVNSTAKTCTVYIA